MWYYENFLQFNNNSIKPSWLIFNINKKEICEINRGKSRSIRSTFSI